jgi:hypothetical protein
MGKSKRTGRGVAPRELTERDRHWLEHLRACARSGETAKGYAARKGLSLGAWYEAKRRLVRRGAWPATIAAAAPRPRFMPVTVATPAPASAPALQLRLANGTTLEWKEAPSPEALALVLSQVRA